MDGLDSLGADDLVGFDYGGLLQAAGGVASYGISAAEQEKKEQAASADEKKKLEAVLAADQAASNAMAKADVSAQLKGPSASIDAQAAQMAVAAQDRAGAAGFSPGSAQKRAEAADKALANAVKNAQAKPKDGYLAALVKAWTATVNKAQSTAIASTDGFKGYGAETPSWFTRPVLGKLPGWGVLTVGAGVLGAAALIVKKVFFK